MARDPYKLYPHDYLLRATVLRLLPPTIRPNHLTVARMLFTPVIIYLLVTENYTLGLPLFVLIAFTDALDGAMARTRRQITPWGILFDPIADKLLIGLTALAVALKYYHDGLVLAAVVFDALPVAAWLLRARRERGVMMANGWGKAKMLLQFTSLTLLLLGVALGLPALIDAGEAVLLVATVLAGVAAVTYSL